MNNKYLSAPHTKHPTLHGEVYSIHYVIKFIIDKTIGYSDFLHQYITEILLKVTLKHHNHNPLFGTLETGMATTPKNQSKPLFCAKDHPVEIYNWPTRARYSTETMSTDDRPIT